MPEGYGKAFLIYDIRISCCGRITVLYSDRLFLFFLFGVIGMKEDKLVVKKNKRHPKRNNVRLSKKDIEELMNVNMSTYYRRNGAWRSK